MAQDDSNPSVFKELPDQAKATVERIKKIIGEDTTKKEGKASSGWGFSSEELSQEIQRLSAELSINGFKAYNCKVLHLVHGGIIQNGTGHQIIIPLNGKASFLHDKPLLPCHYTTQKETILGDNIDLIIMSLKNI
ncbi:hypothetical protein BO82DRAFT_218597 [Aspergillus uvarum CBS 121591]|uniref:Uncharacterized protein n=2 Tax=Aspergillus subgen. Circumdati TaxID=2720871 RepID=A0A319BTU1_9EURO|nr:hypothetical protein BO82DRAFT_218597 [Aspergillus uvarum CBS 121591]PYH76004.1 hypothetical protein BO82DRAFT_218597 [Aspergillus uvarum CBS 121591]PYI33111.1 hypothetical protein BP00DRAFT_129356 [Aspergillus indologenus CBS 114.80]